MNPHPSTCMGDPSNTYGTYIWWKDHLEEKLYEVGLMTREKYVVNY